MGTQDRLNYTFFWEILTFLNHTFVDVSVQYITHV